MNKYESFVGIPFVDHGRDFDACDCWGLVRLVYIELRQIALPSYSAISAHDLLSVARAMKNGQDMGDWQKVELTEVQEYDVIVMSGMVAKAKAPVHVGVMVNNRQMLHTEEGTNSVVVKLDNPTVKNRIIGAYRYAGK